MTLNSAVVVAGDDATAAQYNNVRKDVLLHAGDTLVDSSGAANTITVAIPAQIAALENGMVLKIEVTNTITDATNLSLTGGITDTVDLKDVHLKELSKGDVTAGQYIYCIYDNTNDAFVLISQKYLEKTLYVLTAGETVTAGQPLYFKASDSKLYKLITTANGEAAQAFVGWCVVGGNANDAIVICYEYTNNLSGLTAGSPVFGTDVAGTVGHTAGTVEKHLGTAISTTEVLTKEDMVASGTLTNVPVDTTTVQTVTLSFKPKVLIVTGTSGAYANTAAVSPDGASTYYAWQLNLTGVFANGIATIVTDSKDGMGSVLTSVSAAGASGTIQPTILDSATITCTATKVGVQKANATFAITNTGFTMTPDTEHTGGAEDSRDGYIQNMRYIAYR